MMKIMQISLPIMVVSVFLMGMGSHAQAADNVVRLRDPKLVALEAPTYNVKKKMPGSSNVNRQDWVQILMEYKTAPDWLDKVTVTYYVLTEPKGVSGTRYKLFSGSVNYVNVKKGSHKSVMYMHPTTMERFGKPSKVAAVLTTSYGGRPVEMSTDKQQWWKKLPAESGLLLNRKDTPFAVLNDNEYDAQGVSGDNR